MSRGTRIASEAAPARASRQATAKLLWPRARRRKCGGCAVKDRVLTWGDLALCLKGRRHEAEREVSRGRIRRRESLKGRRSGRSSPAALEVGATQMFTNVKLAMTPATVKPESVWQRGNQRRRVDSQRDQATHGATCAAPSTTPTARCGPARRVVWEGPDRQRSPLSRLRLDRMRFDALLGHVRKTLSL